VRVPVAPVAQLADEVALSLPKRRAVKEKPPVLLERLQDPISVPLHGAVGLHALGATVGQPLLPRILEVLLQPGDPRQNSSPLISVPRPRTIDACWSCCS
jgi:hypothetical protein